MCLILPFGSSKTPLVAEDDIVCYKVLSVNAGMAKSPYQHHPYTLGVSTRSSLGVDPEPETYNAASRGCDTVSVGLHTFTDFEGASAEVDDWGPYGYYVFVAVIPKGAKYFAGIFEGMNLESYVSDELIVYRRDSEFSQKYIRNLAD